MYIKTLESNICVLLPQHMDSHMANIASLYIICWTSPTSFLGSQPHEGRSAGLQYRERWRHFKYSVNLLISATLLKTNIPHCSIRINHWIGEEQSLQKKVLQEIFNLSMKSVYNLFRIVAAVSSRRGTDNFLINVEICTSSPLLKLCGNWLTNQRVFLRVPFWIHKLARNSFSVF